MKRIICCVLALSASVAAVISFNGCSTAPTSLADQEELIQSAQNTLARFKQQDPTMEPFLQRSHGWAIFPEIGQGAVGVGGAYGRGVVYEQGQLIGFCDMTQGTIGLQLGGQSFAQLIVFENKQALDRFTQNNLEFAAQASAVALKAGASSNARFDNGVAVFTATNGGLMFEAAIGGQRFTFQPLR